MVSTYIKTDKQTHDTDPCPSLGEREITDQILGSCSLHTSVSLLYISFLTESPKPAVIQRNPHPEVQAGEEGLLFSTEESCLQ